MLSEEIKNKHVAPSDLVFLLLMGAGLSYQRKHTSELEPGWPPLICARPKLGDNIHSLFLPVSAPQDRCTPRPACPPPRLWSE